VAFCYTAERPSGFQKAACCRHVYKQHRSVVMYPLKCSHLDLMPKRSKTEKKISIYLINFQEI